MSCFSPYSPTSAATSVTANDASSENYPWMEALRDTLSSREFIVMNQVLSQANACQNKTEQNQVLLTYAIPIILQYTLQHQQDLAILTSFAAQGENITAWLFCGGMPRELPKNRARAFFSERPSWEGAMK